MSKTALNIIADEQEEQLEHDFIQKHKYTGKILRMKVGADDEECFRLQDTPFAYTLSLISGKYKMSILYTLKNFEVVRYNELKRFLEGVSFKALTSALRELENDKLIIRKEYAQIPPKVEYRLSKKGQSLMPILEALCEWGKKHKT